MSKMKKLTAGGLLVAMGVVYGDIGTSPLYVMKAIVEDNGGLKTLSRTLYWEVSPSFLDSDSAYHD